MTEGEILRLAESHIASEFPDFDPASLKPVIRDLGNSWEVSYELPAGIAGGTPVVIIEKGSHKVLDVYHTR